MSTNKEASKHLSRTLIAILGLVAIGLIVIGAVALDPVWFMCIAVICAVLGAIPALDRLLELNWKFASKDVWNAITLAGIALAVAASVQALGR